MAVASTKVNLLEPIFQQIGIIPRLRVGLRRSLANVHHCLEQDVISFVLERYLSTWILFCHEPFQLRKPIDDSATESDNRITLSQTSACGWSVGAHLLNASFAKRSIVFDANPGANGNQ